MFGNRLRDVDAAATVRAVAERAGAISATQRDAVAPEPVSSSLQPVEVPTVAIVQARDLLLDPPDDVSHPARSLDAVNARVLSTVERRVGVPSHVACVVVGGADFELDPRYVAARAIYQPGEGTIRLRNAVAAVVRDALESAPDLKPVAYRDLIVRLRDALDTLCHEHLHGVADGAEAQMWWGEKGGGYVFTEGLTELATAFLASDISETTGIAAAFPGVAALPPSEGLESPMCAVLIIVDTLAQRLSRDTADVVLDLVRRGAGIGALSSLLVDEGMARQTPRRHLASAAVSAVLATEAALQALSDSSGNPAPATISEAITAAATALDGIDGAFGAAGARVTRTRVPHDGSAIDAELGSGTADVFEVREQPHTLVVVEGGAGFLISDEDRGDLADADLAVALRTHVASAAAIEPGTTRRFRPPTTLT